MSEFNLGIHAFAIGLAVAAPPIGGVGILCMRRSIDRGFLAGLCTGMGAATADGLFAIGATVGLSAVVGRHPDLVDALKVIGGCFTAYLGYAFLDTPPKKIGERDACIKRSILTDYVSTFLLTITSPAAIMLFAALFAGIGFASTVPTPSLPVGVFLGSMTWWVILSFTMSALGHQISEDALKWINVACGALLIGLGFAGIVSVAYFPG